MKRIVIVLVIAAFLLCGCGKKEAEQTEQRFVIEYEQRLGYFGSIIITRDTETGKAYLFEKYGYAGGMMILEEGET